MTYSYILLEIHRYLISFLKSEDFFSFPFFFFNTLFNSNCSKGHVVVFSLPFARISYFKISNGSFLFKLSSQNSEITFFLRLVRFSFFLFFFLVARFFFTPNLQDKSTHLICIRCFKPRATFVEIFFLPPPPPSPSSPSSFIAQNYSRRILIVARAENSLANSRRGAQMAIIILIKMSTDVEHLAISGVFCDCY